MSQLPIEDVLPEIGARLQDHSRLVIAAPPGAGKTTRLPLYLLETAPWLKGQKLLLLEPRRVAARMAAERMAKALGEKVGERVGLSTRIDRRVSARTRIEVITDGLFARRILSDPELTGVGAVLFDEFHERSLNVDLGLALARDVQGALRDDLRLVLMSATLDTGAIAASLSAPIVESQGRAFPVSTVYLGKPEGRIEEAMATAIRRALREEDGSILCFLPGQGEIRRVAEAIAPLASADTLIAPLYGALSPAEQDAAIAPPASGVRKIVLATDIAESALTIEGVRVVIDAGLARVPTYDPASGATQLSTQRASLANVDQRRGRAGRTAPGVCYRLWAEGATAGLPKSPAPEVTTANLAGLVMTLAEWGASDATGLDWIDGPPEARLAAAKKTLGDIGALDQSGSLTTLGRKMARLPLDPELAALIAKAEDPQDAALAARLAILISEPGLGGPSTDLTTSLRRLDTDKSQRARTLLRQAARWADAPPSPIDQAGRILADALPTRIARRSGTAPGQFQLATGQQAMLDEKDPLATHDWLAIGGLTGAARRLRILSAAPLSEEDALAAGDVSTTEEAFFDDTGKIRARRIRKLRAITLSSHPIAHASREMVIEALTDKVRREGIGILPCADEVSTFLARLRIAESVTGEEWARLEEATLLDRASDWLHPAFGKSPQLSDLTPGVFRQAHAALLPWDALTTLNTLAPPTCPLPSGRKAPIDYCAEGGPLLEARVQELYGEGRHPTIGRGTIPLTLSLTSPAGREVARIRDLPSFWHGGYKDMAKDMRARYPKHDWPEDPATAPAHEGRTKAHLRGD